MTRTTWLAACVLAWWSAAEAAAPPAQRLDFLGDPLPPGAVARIGSARLAADPAGIHGVVFSADGKEIISLGSVPEDRNEPGVRYWDAKTGRFLRAFPLNGGLQDETWISKDRRVLAGLIGRELVTVEGGTGRKLQRFTLPETTRLNARSTWALSPDGKTLAVGWRPDATVRLYDTKTGKECAVLRGCVASPERLCFSRDGKLVAAGEGKGRGRKQDEELTQFRIHVWEVTSGEALRPFAGHAQGVHWVEFSPDGRFLLSSAIHPSLGDRVHLWDVKTGKLSGTLGDFSCESQTVTFSPDGKTVAVKDSTDVYLFDWPGRRLQRTIKRVAGRVAFSPDGRSLVGVVSPLWKDSKTIGVWDVATGQMQEMPRGHGGPIENVALSPDGKTLAALSRTSNTLKLWDVRSGRPLRSLAQIPQDVPVYFAGPAFSPDGKVLSWVQTGRDSDSRVRMWDLQAAREGKPPKGLWEPPLSSPKGELAAIAIDQGKFNPKWLLWDCRTNKEAPGMPDLRPEERVVQFGGDGRTLVLVSKQPARQSKEQEQIVRLWDLEARRLRSTVRTADGAPLALSPDGRFLASGDRRAGKVHLWDAGTGNLRRSWSASGAWLWPLAFSRDGKLLATVTNGGRTVGVWETATGRDVVALAAVQVGVGFVGFLPDGRHLVSWAYDGAALVWDLFEVKSPHAKPFSREDKEQLWQTLLRADADWFALAAQAARTSGFVPVLRRQLRPVEHADRKRVRKWIASLDAEEFAVRQEASAALEKLGGAVESELRRALRASPPQETRSRIGKLLSRLPELEDGPERVRERRAVYLLEHLGTADAQTLLRELAKGEPEAWLTKDAAAALGRFQAAKSPAPKQK
jgi:WD40 repeat protein